MNYNKIIKEIKNKANPERAKSNERFFKTGKGEYGEGDKFLGLSMLEQRNIVKKYYQDANFTDIQRLLDSKYHEYRMVGLLILVYKFEKADKKLQKQIYNFYLKNTKGVNNWDLVDVTTPKVVGVYLATHTCHFEHKNCHPELDSGSREILYKFAKSKNLWEKRIAIISTYGFIRVGEYNDTLKISEILLNDKHDLIHKAVGWMLREVGNRDREVEEKFLKKHYKKMPRTMLRYAIEKFPKPLYKKYLKGEV